MIRTIQCLVSIFWLFIKLTHTHINTCRPSHPHSKFSMRSQWSEFFEEKVQTKKTNKKNASPNESSWLVSFFSRIETLWTIRYCLFFCNGQSRKYREKSSKQKLTHQFEHRNEFINSFILCLERTTKTKTKIKKTNIKLNKKKQEIYDE